MGPGQSIRAGVNSHDGTTEYAAPAHDGIRWHATMLRAYGTAKTSLHVHGYRTLLRLYCRAAHVYNQDTYKLHSC